MFFLHPLRHKHLSSFCLWCPFIHELLKTVSFSCVLQLYDRHHVKINNKIAHILLLFSQRFVSFSSLYGSTDVLYFQAQSEISFPHNFYLWKRLIFYFILIFYLKSSYYKGVPSAPREGT